MNNTRRILLGLTGSVATVLYKKLITELQTIGIVDVILTEHAGPFVDLSQLCDALEQKGGMLYVEKDEWTWKHDGNLSNKWRKNDPVLHIELRNNHCALVIAPCSVNTLAKIANGFCDNLLTSVARAWDFNRPFVIAPAANTNMFLHPLTGEHLLKFISFSKNNYNIPAQTKMLACGVYGAGAMGEISDIVNTTKTALQWHFPISNDCVGIPVENHPGAFKSKRKNSTHTGIDLYVDERTLIKPVEDGIVVTVEPFTGPKDNSPWWLDTDCVLVEGASGVVCYGEIEPLVKVGDKVCKGITAIGKVKRVIPPDKPQHPEIVGWRPSMLHIELYPHNIYKPSNGYEQDKNILIDPTSYLIDSKGAPRLLLK